MLQKELIIETGGRALIDITARIAQTVSGSGVEAGLCHVFFLHTSASLLINENADPDVLAVLETFFSGLVEVGDKRSLHRAGGLDDKSAHIRGALMHTELSLSTQNTRLALGPEHVT